MGTRQMHAGTDNGTQTLITTDNRDGQAVLTEITVEFFRNYQRWQCCTILYIVVY